ncbi:MAG: uroporphyrinogen-III synthase [Coriobacteriia bacterium]|nr:uroporphyrinogen-III synthase [Coriobacteriia bacterium]
MSSGPSPLAGVRVVVTRTAAQSAALSGPLMRLGAEVIVLPVIRVANPPDPMALAAALLRLTSYEWLVLTSANAVEQFFARLASLDDPGVDAAADDPDRYSCFWLPAGIKVAVVGKATAARLKEYGFNADLIPGDFRAEGLVAAFSAAGVDAGTRVLIPRAAEARETLPAGLRELGAHVDTVELYQLVAEIPEPAVFEQVASGAFDVITFASGATARFFARMLEGNGVNPAEVFSAGKVASIGPVTSQAIRELGYGVDIEAPVQDMGALAGAIALEFGTAGSA